MIRALQACLAACLLAAFLACAARPAAPQLRLSPTSLGASLALQQQLTATVGSQTHRLEVLLEADSQAVRLAILSLGQTAARLLEEAIVREGADTVAAFIAEPIHGGGGVLYPTDDYFPLVRQVCERHQVLFIADEVITGFCRTGK